MQFIKYRFVLFDNIFIFHKNLAYNNKQIFTFLFYIKFSIKFTLQPFLETSKPTYQQSTENNK